MRQLRRGPPRVKNVKEERRRNVVAFVLRPVRLITLKYERESSVWTCTSIGAIRERDSWYDIFKQSTKIDMTKI